MPLCKKKQVAAKEAHFQPIRNEWSVLARYYVWDVVALFPLGFWPVRVVPKSKQINNNSVSHAVLRSVRLVIR